MQIKFSEDVISLLEFKIIRPQQGQGIAVVQGLAEYEENEENRESMNVDSRSTQFVLVERGGVEGYLCDRNKKYNATNHRRFKLSACIFLLWIILTQTLHVIYQDVVLQFE